MSRPAVAEALSKKYHINVTSNVVRDLEEGLSFKWLQKYFSWAIENFHYQPSEDDFRTIGTLEYGGYAHDPFEIFVNRPSNMAKVSLWEMIQQDVETHQTGEVSAKNSTYSCPLVFPSNQSYFALELGSFAETIGLSPGSVLLFRQSQSFIHESLAIVVAGQRSFLRSPQHHGGVLKFLLPGEDNEQDSSINVSGSSILALATGVISPYADAPGFNNIRWNNGSPLRFRMNSRH